MLGRAGWCSPLLGVFHVGYLAPSHTSEPLHSLQRPPRHGVLGKFGWIRFDYFAAPGVVSIAFIRVVSGLDAQYSETFSALRVSEITSIAVLLRLPE